MRISSEYYHYIEIHCADENTDLRSAESAHGGVKIEILNSNALVIDYSLLWEFPALVKNYDFWIQNYTFS